MANYRVDSSEEEALFRSYPYTLYFVQSPSTISHANTNVHNYINSPEVNNNNNDDDSFIIIPTTPQPLDHHRTPPHRGLSSSSSRGSNHSFFDYKKMYYFSHDNDGAVKNVVARDRDEEDDDDLCDEKRGGWVRYFSFGYSDSGWWIMVQLSWRFLLSLIVALVVFYVAAKPPAPKVSLKIAGIRQLRLGEGVDGSGVTTKILSCNCSMDVIIDNKSKLFALHIHPPTMEILFAHLPFAMSQGIELNAGNDDTTMFRLNVGVKNKPMYGAGRTMQDLLQSGAGLPWVVRMRLRSSYHVVWGLFVSKFHHEAQCLVVLSDKYDKKRMTQVYNSTCTIH